MMYFQKKESGFSLVETLVAISILLIVIVGPMTISMRTAKSSSFASEQIQAFFLAQEGVEFLHKHSYDYYVRHFSGSVTDPWGQTSDPTGAYANCFSSSGCGVEWSTTAGALRLPISCATVSNCLMYRSSGTGRSHFTHIAAGNTATVFTRRLYFSEHIPSTQVRVRSVVTWRTGSLVAEQRVEIDTYLYNEYGTP